MNGIYKIPRIAVEIDPPEKGAGKSEFLIDSANALKQAGADAVTIADNPTSRVRADSVVMASRVWRETGIKVIPHLTCRDRTREGLQSALLALDAEGLSTVLAVTGDPVSAEKIVTGTVSFSRTLVIYSISQCNKRMECFFV